MSKLTLEKYSRYFLLLAIIIFLHFTSILRPIENFAQRLSNPLLSGFYSLSANLRLIYNKETKKINSKEEINKLTIQVNNLLKENTKLKIVSNENKVLREHLNFLTKNNYKYVLARVISRGNISNILGRTEVITLNKGTNDGLVVGLAVVNGQGVIVGKISAVSNTTAEVYLTNNKECKLAAMVLNKNKTSGITEGELGLTIKMKFIPQEINIKTGNIAVTSGLEKFIPRGLLIGKVISVSKENNNIWQIASLEPLTDPENLTIVSIILPTNK